jgi:outer membrane biosynthesis protein TonB
MRWSKEALRNKAQEKVTVGFIIEKDGSVDSARAISKIDNDEDLEKKAIHVVSSTPK